MSDRNSYSPIDLFKAPAAQSMSGRKKSSEIGAFNSYDSTFSNELSRASERNTPSEKSLDRSAYNEVGPKQRESSQQARTDDNNNRTKKPSDVGTASSSNVQRTDKGPTSEKSVPKKTSDEQAVGNDKSADENAVASAGSEAVTSAEKHDSLSDTGMNPETEAEDIKAVELTSSMKALTVTDKELSENTQTQDANRTDAVLDVAAVLKGDGALVEPAINKVGETIKSDIKQPVAGEQMSLDQLVKRRAPLIENAAAPIPGKVDSVQKAASQAMAGADTENSASRSASVASINVGATVRNINEKSLKAGTLDPNGDGTAKPVLIRTIAAGTTAELRSADIPLTGRDAGSPTLSQKETASRLQVAEVNLTELMAARKADQQMNQNNLAQNRQMAQQHAQNMLLSTAITAPQPVDAANQSPDNMFLSVSGGIVTAPLVGRTDTGNNQATNAPLNLPILQNDADKAMSGNIKWMIKEGVKNAVVNVTPSGMGPISVSIGIEKDQMNVSIIALQGSTREALDSMLPRLREQLATLGQDSVKVDISDGRADQSDRGYGHQFAGDQNDDGRETQPFGSRGMNEELRDGMEVESENASSDSYGSINLDGNTQIISRYDVYV